MTFEEQIQFIKENYLEYGYKALGKFTGRSETFVKSRMRKMGLTVPEELLAKRRNESRFHKGMTVWNKGVKGLQLSPATQFKKGHLPANTKSDGEVTKRNNVSKDGKITPYLYIRLRQAKWVELHKHIWEQRFGPIPKGMCLWFKNGNTLEVTLENLELITRAENLRRNSFYRLNGLKKAVRTDKYYISKITKDRKLQKELLKFPEILELKKQQLLLKKGIANAVRKQAS